MWCFPDVFMVVTLACFTVVVVTTFLAGWVAGVKRNG